MATEFSVIIHTDNEAFSNSNEITRLLRVLADKMDVEMPEPYGAIYDINGNVVGSWLHTG